MSEELLKALQETSFCPPHLKNRETLLKVEQLLPKWNSVFVASVLDVVPEWVHYVENNPGALIYWLYTEQEKEKRSLVIENLLKFPQLLSSKLRIHLVATGSLPGPLTMGEIVEFFHFALRSFYVTVDVCFKVLPQKVPVTIDLHTFEFGRDVTTTAVLLDKAENITPEPTLYVKTCLASNNLERAFYTLALDKVRWEEVSRQVIERLKRMCDYKHMYDYTKKRYYKLAAKALCCKGVLEEVLDSLPQTPKLWLARASVNLDLDPVLKEKVRRIV